MQSAAKSKVRRLPKEARSTRAESLLPPVAYTAKLTSHIGSD